MILVDIQVPVMDSVYDFELAEEIQVELLLEDILWLIEKKEKLDGKQKGVMRLYALRQECFLKAEETLKGQGVGSGDRLILI